MKAIRRILCFFGIHCWAEHHQELFVTCDSGKHKTDTVIAWDNCKHCYKTRLIHILK